VVQLSSKGTTRGMLIGLSPDSSSTHIIEPGQVDVGSRAAERSYIAVSETAGDVGIRVVSRGIEGPTTGGTVSQRKPSGLGQAPDIERR
jgi:hypothetical protein